MSEKIPSNDIYKENSPQDLPLSIKKTTIGKLAGTLQFKKDIVSPIDEPWNANS